MNIYLMGHTAKGCTIPRHSDREWSELRLRCGCRCFYCAKLIDGDGTKDHLTPISRGGCQCIGNLVEACLRCNSMKGSKTVQEFLKMKPYFNSVHSPTGKFYNAVIALGSLVESKADPLLREFCRIVENKSFPEPRNLPERRNLPADSPYWRTKQ